MIHDFESWLNLLKICLILNTWILAFSIFVNDKNKDKMHINVFYF